MNFLFHTITASHIHSRLYRVGEETAVSLKRDLHPSLLAGRASCNSQLYRRYMEKTSA